MCEALIDQIAVTADDTVRPTFRLPLASNDEGPALEGPAQPTCRFVPTLVDRTWQNKNRIFPVQGPYVTVPPVRRRVARRR
jgi:hypothetical protein